MLPSFTFHQLAVLLALTFSNALVLAWWLDRPLVMSRVKSRILARSYGAPCFVAIVLALIWVGIFVIARYPMTGDTLTYQAQGRMVTEGFRPNVDFGSSYMPVFPYLMGAIYTVWHDPHAIALFFVMTFVVGAALLMKLDVGSTTAMSADLRALVILGALNGAAWFLAIGYQQDESLMFMLVVVGLALLQRKSDLLLGLMLAMALFSTKLLFAVLCIAFFAVALKPRVVLAGFTGAGVALALAFSAWGFRPSMMFAGESGQITGPSLLALLAAVPAVEGGLAAHSWVAPALGVVAILAVALAVWRRKGTGGLMNDALLGVTAVWLAFLLVSPKSLTSYRLVVLPLIPVVLFLLGRRTKKHAVSFVVYSTVLGVQYMLYEDWVSSKYALFIGSHFSQPSALMGLAIVLLADGIILGYEISLLWAILSQFRRSIPMIPSDR